MFAEDQCAHDWVLALDSDEVVSPALAAEIGALKRRAFDATLPAPPDGFTLLREWIMLGTAVHAFYPVRTPDRVIRLFRRDRISHRNSRIIHESAGGPDRRVLPLKHPLLHYTCDSVEQLYSKIGLYTRLAAQDMHERGDRATAIKLHV